MSERLKYCTQINEYSIDSIKMSVVKVLFNIITI